MTAMINNVEQRNPQQGTTPSLSTTNAPQQETDPELKHNKCTAAGDNPELKHNKRTAAGDNPELKHNKCTYSQLISRIKLLEFPSVDHRWLDNMGRWRFWGVSS